MNLPLRPSVLVIGPLGLALGGAWWWLDGNQTMPLHLSVVDLLLFAAAAAVMELLPVRLSDGRAVPTSLAVVGAAALLGASPPLVALIAVLGYVTAAVVRSGDLGVATVGSRAFGGWTLAGVAAVGAALGPPTWAGDVDLGAAASLNLGAAVAVAVAVLLGFPVVAVLTTGGSLRHGWRRVAEAIHRKRLVGAAIATTAALGALVHPVLGAWTLPTMLLPLAAARAGLDRLALGQRAYDQTIRAMSRLPEQLGTVDAGHGVRVAEFAREVALELGLDAVTVEETVRAAYLHELGRIKLEREVPAPPRELALAGARVLREVGDLDRVADIVEAQAQPMDRDCGDVGLPARIVVACCELDSYLPELGAAGQRHETTVRLVRGIGDLAVVTAVTRVLDRRAELADG